MTFNLRQRKNTPHGFCLLLLLLLLTLLVPGCASIPHDVNTHFLDHHQLTSALQAIAQKHSPVVETFIIGKSYEGRAITAIRITRRTSPVREKPAVLALFGEHAGEHETTALAMGMVKYLMDNHQTDGRISRLLEDAELWIIPMMNPDGVAFDLSGAGKPFSYRKNRRPTGAETWGVDLNRNWGYHLDTQAAVKDAGRLSRRESPNYAGDKPFSEPETRVVRDFMSAHPNIRILLDYHSGSAGFMQGAVGCASGMNPRKGIHLRIDAFCNGLVDRFAEDITDSSDSRPGFLVMSHDRSAELLKKRLPFYMRPFVPSKFFEEPGTAVNYAYDRQGIAAIGIEIFRDSRFLCKLPGSQGNLLQNQLRGLLQILDDV